MWKKQSGHGLYMHLYSKNILLQNALRVYYGF